MHKYVRMRILLVTKCTENGPSPSLHCTFASELNVERSERSLSKIFVSHPGLATCTAVSAKEPERLVVSAPQRIWGPAAVREDRNQN